MVFYFYSMQVIMTFFLFPDTYIYLVIHYFSLSYSGCIITFKQFFTLLRLFFIFFSRIVCQTFFFRLPDLEDDLLNSELDLAFCFHDRVRGVEKNLLHVGQALDLVLTKVDVQGQFLVSQFIKSCIYIYYTYYTCKYLIIPFHWVSYRDNLILSLNFLWSHITQKESLGIVNKQ